ncbi:MAG: alkaline phosphatase family protein [Saprospiraceae bacterium]|nr:alkaline phosphatase family protein [Saprospiraceae bacterium]
MIKYSSFLVTLFLLVGTIQAQQQRSLLQSGPMVGYSEMKEVLLWVQTTEAANVRIDYVEKGTRQAPQSTRTIRTQSDQAFVAKLIADQVEPGLTYTYQVFINEGVVTCPYPTEFQTQGLWQWRGDPPEFTIALGSCTYINEPKVDRPGSPYGQDMGIFKAIQAKKPDAMIWLGDNIYLREVDWFSRTGIQHRYTHMRSQEALQPFLANVHHYAIWDDHDFGPNDSDRTYIHKDKTREAFELFWGNPTTGLPGQEGITTAFQWGDVDFFLLDNRTFRSPDNCKTCEPTILGEAQLNWLIEALTSSIASFKIVAIGGQVLNPAAVFENYANRHAPERTELLRRIEAEGITGVVFISGDRHHTELSKMTFASGVDIYDWTVSPLTSTPSTKNENEGNTLRMGGTYVNVQNFGVLKVSGPQTDRALTLSTFDQHGDLLWKRKILQSK